MSDEPTEDDGDIDADDIDTQVAAFAAELEDDTEHTEGSFGLAARVMSPDVNAGDVECWIVNCMRCGVTLFLDPRDDVSVVKLHLAWHARSGA